MGSLWKDLLRLERRCQRRQLFRTLSGNVVVCDMDLARASLDDTDHRLSFRPPFWRPGGRILEEPVRKKLNHWVVRRLAIQDPADCAEIAVKRVMSEKGDLHHICTQSLIDGLSRSMDCAEDARLDRAVRRFFSMVFVPTIRGELTRRQNEDLFERACIEAGTALEASGRDIFPEELGFKDSKDFTWLGELYLRRTAAFIGASAVTLGWLVCALHSPTPVSISGSVSRADIKTTDPRWIALECLRLWPASWQHRRVVLQDHKIGSLTALEGDDVQIPVYAVQRHPKLWEDADRFDPGRWENRTQKDILPFSRGPGSCVAEHFSMKFLTTASAILREESLPLEQVGKIPHVTTSFSFPDTNILPK